MSNKRETFRTPAGLTGFTCLNKPSTKFKADGVYSVELLLPPEEAAPLQEQFKKMAEEAKAEKVKETPKVKTFNLHVPGTPQLDKEGNETGLISFQFKQDAVVRPKGKDAFEPKIGLFDAKGKPLSRETAKIGRGSKVKVAYEPAPFANPATKMVGISLRLKAVQVLDLKSFSGGTAEDYGFGEEEGYVAEESGEQSEGGEAPEGKGNGDF